MFLFAVFVAVLLRPGAPVYAAAAAAAAACAFCSGPRLHGAETGAAPGHPLQQRPADMRRKAVN